MLDQKYQKEKRELKKLGGKPLDSVAFIKEVKEIRDLMLKNDPDRFKEYERATGQ